MSALKGTIYIHAEAERALRQGGRALQLADILDCAGHFNRGDQVHLVVRGADGGQGVVATSTIECSIDSLQQALHLARSTSDASVASSSDAVCLASAIRWLWADHTAG